MKNILLLLASLFIISTFTGCGEETAGDKLDKAVDSTKEASKDTWDNIKKAVDK